MEASSSVHKAMVVNAIEKQQALVISIVGAHTCIYGIKLSLLCGGTAEMQVYHFIRLDCDPIATV